jgi:hypothetical protein
MKATLIILLFIISSCANERKDVQFCKCLEAGHNLNKKTAEYMGKSVTQEQKGEAMALKGIKERACENYKTTAGPEMRKKMKLCFESK